jgi:hypothetical protein
MVFWFDDDARLPPIATTTSTAKQNHKKLYLKNITTKQIKDYERL